ncbi:50S ribosomal protein L37ae [Candidatus Woesearchaeota archaeon]|nr:50S ribosomal protein L37ae [Candidatus Woesearchaeota archaeon]MCF7901335.1 50S ribosomal protein L37ae [Candidatus Woesearchaeota archaeon]MCF8014032.1 50S ribosomal protein L37ae [Candidatus Woesearchaeota archaeon]
MAEKKSKTTNRFGPRYGRTTKSKVSKIETAAKAKYKCPFCTKQQVKRVQAGIWECTSCNKKFTGKAYQMK